MSSRYSQYSWRPVLFFLALLDFILFGVAFFLSCWLWISSGLFPYEAQADTISYIKLYVISLPLLFFIFYTTRLYDPQELFYGTVEYILIIKAVSFVVISVIVIGFFVQHPTPRMWAAIFWPFAVSLVILNRFLFRRLVRSRLKEGLVPDRTIIIGSGEEAKAIAERLIETGRMEVVGFLNDFNPIGQEVIPGIPIKGASLDYKRIATRENISHIIVVPGTVGWETIQEILSNSKNDNSFKISMSPGFGALSVRLKVSYIGYVPLLHFQPGYNTELDKIIKRLFDLVLATCIFILSLPIQISLIFWILWRKGRPIFIVKEKLGRFATPFKEFSFRIGPQEFANDNSFLEIQKEERNLKKKPFSFENFIVRCRVNKLPQLFNVIMGQMSIVGPRPLRKETARLYGIWLPRLLSVKPGLTGPWSVSKINDRQYEISQIISYLGTWSLWKDVQFLLLSTFYIIQHFIPSWLNGRKSKDIINKKFKQQQDLSFSETKDITLSTVTSRNQRSTVEHLKDQTYSFGKSRLDKGYLSDTKKLGQTKKVCDN